MSITSLSSSITTTTDLDHCLSENHLLSDNYCLRAPSPLPPTTTTTNNPALHQQFLHFMELWNKQISINHHEAL
uniref:Uncharacterized protein n=1 Tax=Onchocerca volvulus TaxID=6282 RepID=A0A8R1U1P2_ONCVO